MTTSILGLCWTLLQSASCCVQGGSRGDQGKKWPEAWAATRNSWGDQLYARPCCWLKGPQHRQFPLQCIVGAAVTPQRSWCLGAAPHASPPGRPPGGPNPWVKTVQKNKNFSAHWLGYYTRIVRYFWDTGAQASFKNQQIRISGYVTWTCTFKRNSCRWIQMNVGPELKKKMSLPTGKRGGARVWTSVSTPLPQIPVCWNPSPQRRWY